MFQGKSTEVFPCSPDLALLPRRGRGSAPAPRETLTKE
jgi:hypothetical protein